MHFSFCVYIEINCIETVNMKTCPGLLWINSLLNFQKETLTRFTSKFSWVSRTGSSGRGPACNSPRRGSRNTRTTRIILSVCDPNEVLIPKPNENHYHSIHRTSTCRTCVQHHPQNQSNKTNRTKFFLSAYWLQPVPFCFGWNSDKSHDSVK